MDQLYQGERPSTLEECDEGRGAYVQEGGIFRSFLLHPSGPVDVYPSGSSLAVSAKDYGASFEFMEGALSIIDPCADRLEGVRLACAAFEFLFATKRDVASIELAGDGWQTLLPELKRRGLAVESIPPLASPSVFAEMFWQMPEFWLAAPPVAYPQRDVFDGKTEHPLRPPKPEGCVYARFVPWLSGMLSFHVATLDDLPDVHRWMNDPRVDEFWKEAGNEAAHGRYLERLLADPHVIPLIGRFNEQAFSYFEIYWAKEDLVGPFCGATDYDRGCHVIVGEGAFRGRSWFTAWLPSLLHLMFLDDARTGRIVQEPSAEHHRQLRNLQLSGFSHTRSVDLPTKRAAIMSISRRHFFSNRLWHPAVMPERRRP